MTVNDQDPRNTADKDSLQEQARRETDLLPENWITGR